MFFKVCKGEFNKIICSSSFKIAFFLIILCSVYNIVSEYRKFSNYDYIYECHKKTHTNRIKQAKDYFVNLEQGNIKSTYCDIELEKKIYNKELEFLSSNDVLKLEKSFVQGFSKSIFECNYWLLIFLLFCSNIVCFERTKNLMKIQFSTSVSRVSLYHSKYIAMIAAMSLIFICNLIFSYFFSESLMGFSDLSGNMRSVLDYDLATVERSIKEMLFLKIVFSFLTFSSAAVIFIFVSTIVKDFITSYIISALLVLNSNAFYCTIRNGFGISKYFFISFYSGCEGYIIGNEIYDIKIAIISMIIQTFILYILGLYVYTKVEFA